MNKKTQQSLIILVGGDINREESLFSPACLFVGHTLSFLTTWHVKNWKKNLWNYFSHPRVSCQCQSSVIVIVLIFSYFIIRSEAGCSNETMQWDSVITYSKLPFTWDYKNIKTKILMNFDILFTSLTQFCKLWHSIISKSDGGSNSCFVSIVKCHVSTHVDWNYCFLSIFSNNVAN